MHYALTFIILHFTFWKVAFNFQANLDVKCVPLYKTCADKLLMHINKFQKFTYEINVCWFVYLLIDRNRCSHFLSVCYLANAIFKHKLFPYKSCPRGCIRSNAPLFGLTKYSFKPIEYSSLVKLMHIGQDVPEE